MGFREWDIAFGIIIGASFLGGRIEGFIGHQLSGPGVALAGVLVGALVFFAVSL